jgi:hypothetical protein
MLTSQQAKTQKALDPEGTHLFWSHPPSSVTLNCEGHVTIQQTAKLRMSAGILHKGMSKFVVSHWLATVSLLLWPIISNFLSDTETRKRRLRVCGCSADRRLAFTLHRVNRRLFNTLQETNVQLKGKAVRIHVTKA